VTICLVLCLSLFFSNCCFVIVKVSFIGILTYKSLILYVIILWLLFILSAEILCARFSEFRVLYWFSSCRCCFKMSFSFFFCVRVHS
jgi:hypothetical protein